jgi:hypothetical protein
MMQDEERLAELTQRIHKLDRLLAYYTPPPPAEHPSQITVDEAEFWSARIEERAWLQCEIDSLLARQAG